MAKTTTAVVNSWCSPKKMMMDEYATRFIKFVEDMSKCFGRHYASVNPSTAGCLSSLCDCLAVIEPVRYMQLLREFVEQENDDGAVKPYMSALHANLSRNVRTTPTNVNVGAGGSKRSALDAELDVRESINKKLMQSFSFTKRLSDIYTDIVENITEEYPGEVVPLDVWNAFVKVFNDDPDSFSANIRSLDQAKAESLRNEWYLKPGDNIIRGTNPGNVPVAFSDIVQYFKNVTIDAEEKELDSEVYDEWDKLYSSKSAYGFFDQNEPNIKRQDNIKLNEVRQKVKIQLRNLLPETVIKSVTGVGQDLFSVLDRWMYRSLLLFRYYAQWYGNCFYDTEQGASSEYVSVRRPTTEASLLFMFLMKEWPNVDFLNNAPETSVTNKFTSFMYDRQATFKRQGPDRHFSVMFNDNRWNNIHTLCEELRPPSLRMTNGENFLQCSDFIRYINLYEQIIVVVRQHRLFLSLLYSEYMLKCEQAFRIVQRTW